MTAIFCAISLRRACEVKQYSRIAETGSAERRCPSAGDDLPALMMADRERGENMTKEEFDSVTRDLLVAWFIEMYEYISGGEQAQKIEPLQKRQLIATAQSLLHDIQDALDSELKGSDK